MSFLQVCPSVINLLPGKGVRIEVSFCPPKALPEQGLAKIHDTAGEDQENERREQAEAAAAAEAVAAAPVGEASSKDEKKKKKDKPKAAAAASAPKQPTSKIEEKTHEDEPCTTADGDDSGAPQEEGGNAGDCLPLVPLYAGVVDEGGVTKSEDWVEAEAEGAEEAEEHGEEEEPWSRHGRWRVPCFLKGATGVAVNSSGDGIGGRGGGNMLLPPLALEVCDWGVRRLTACCYCC